jgi:hypothetical protein
MRTLLPSLAQNGHGAMSDLSPLCAPKRTLANASGCMVSRPSSGLAGQHCLLSLTDAAARMFNV